MDEQTKLPQIEQTEKSIGKIIKAREYNDKFAQLFAELGDLAKMDEDYSKAEEWYCRARNIRLCHNIMKFDHYIKQGIKNFTWTMHCKDRFCPLCAKDKANKREQQYLPILNDAVEKYDLYHLTLTMTNCRGIIYSPYIMPEHLKNLRTLPQAINLMMTNIKKLIRYFNGNLYIKGIDFAQYGYAGCLRSLEICPKSNKTYHPHFHVIIALKKGLVLSGKNINSYSYDYITKSVYPFSDFEILIQKIWRLIIDTPKGTKIIKSDIDKLKEGYSCKIRLLSQSDYHQTFKYAIKPDKDVNLTIEIVEDLRIALTNRRFVQGYGCFHGLKLDEDLKIDNSVYDDLIIALNSVELPIECQETPEYSRDQIKQGKVHYISPRSVRAGVRKCGLTVDAIKEMILDKGALITFKQIMMNLPAAEPKEFDLKYLDGSRDIKSKPETVLSIDNDDWDIF